MAVTIFVGIKSASIYYYSWVSVFCGLNMKATVSIVCFHEGCNNRPFSILDTYFVSSNFTYSIPHLHDAIMKGLVAPLF